MSSQASISFSRKGICHGVRSVYHDYSIQETIIMLENLQNGLFTE